MSCLLTWEWEVVSLGACVHLRSNHGCGVLAPTAVGGKELLQPVTISKQDPSRGWM